MTISTQHVREFLYDGKYSMETWKQADAIARRLARMKKADDILVFGPRILKLMQGVPYSVFEFLDEKPGRWGYMNGRF